MSIGSIEIVPIAEYEEAVQTRVDEKDLVVDEIYSAMFTLRSVELWAARLNVVVNHLRSPRENNYIGFWEKDSDMRTLPGLITERMLDGFVTCEYKPTPHYITFMKPGSKTLDWETGILQPYAGPIRSTLPPKAAELGT